MNMEMVFKRGAILGCDVLFCQDCGWNTTHIYGFHDSWKYDPSPSSFPDDHDYWKLSGKTSSVATGAGASEGSGAVIPSQRHSDISEVISCHEGEVYDSSFSSLLTYFSKVLDNLK